MCAPTIEPTVTPPVIDPTVTPPLDTTTPVVETPLGNAVTTPSSELTTPVTSAPVIERVLEPAATEIVVAVEVAPVEVASLPAILPAALPSTGGGPLTFIASLFASLGLGLTIIGQFIRRT